MTPSRIFRTLWIVVALMGTTSGTLIAQQTVRLNNGDRLTGNLKRIDEGGGQWVFTYNGQDVTLDAADVAGFVSDTPIGVRLLDGAIGATPVSEVPGGLRLVLPGGVRTVAATQIAAVGDPTDLEALAPLRVGFLTPLARFWMANAAFGFSDKSGNSRARGLSATLDVERRTPKDRITIGFGMNREESRSASNIFETTVSKYYGTLRLDVFAGARVFFFAATRQERDRFQDLALRSTYTGGLGYQIVTGSETDLSFSVAGGARRENFISAGSETAAVAALGSKLRHDFGPAVLLWRVDFSPELAGPEDFRFVSDASVTAPLFAGIGFRVGVLHEYDSRPQPGIEKNDLLLTTRLSYTIGQ